jgi:hypothetical protein
LRNMPRLHQITHYLRNKCLTPKLLCDKTHAQFPNIKSWTLVLRFIMLVLRIYHQQIHKGPHDLYIPRTYPLPLFTSLLGLPPNFTPLPLLCCDFSSSPCWIFRGFF